MWWYAAAGLGAVIVLVALMAIIGKSLPQGHVAARRVRLRQPAETIWQAISDIDGFTSWRTNLKRLERLPDRDGKPVWREFTSQGTLTLEQIEAVPPRRMVGRIADPKLPFGGTWTYEIEPADGGSQVTITENGEIYNPLFRFLARYFFGYHGALETYLKQLGKKFGEEVVLETVEEPAH